MGVRAEVSLHTLGMHVQLRILSEGQVSHFGKTGTVLSLLLLVGELVVASPNSLSKFPSALSFFIK